MKLTEKEYNFISMALIKCEVMTEYIINKFGDTDEFGKENKKFLSFKNFLYKTVKITGN